MDFPKIDIEYNTALFCARVCHRFNMEMILRICQSVVWHLILFLLWVAVNTMSKSQTLVIWKLHIGFWICVLINLMCMIYIQKFNNNDNVVGYQYLLKSLKKQIKLF